MKHIYSLIAMFAFGFSVLFAQVDTSGTSLSTGSKALQFEIGSNFQLQGFEGALISYKKHISANKARRISVSLSARHSNLHSKVDPYDSNRVFLDGVESHVYFQAILSIQKYTEVKKQVAFYYGYGFVIGFYHQWDDPIPQYVTTSNEYSIGPVGYVGAEWFIRDNISLLGEYSVFGRYRFTYAKYTYEYVSPPEKHKVTTKGHAFSLEQQPVKLGLSFYF